MCATCGCATGTAETGHHHGHPPSHGHSHADDGARAGVRSGGGTVVTLEQQVLARNDRLAERNRRRLSDQQVVAVNLMGSPGAGKTSLLERTAGELGAEVRLHVIEGDQATDRDASRLRAVGCPVLQLNTGTGCHLDARMIDAALTELQPPPHSVLVIENVGNLVCPALFDLGEHARVVVCSVTEGDDKPLKYPHMFRAADLLVLNKTDLLPYVPFELARFVERARQVNPAVRVVPVSAAHGDGIDDWYDWLRSLLTDGAG